MTQAGTSQDVAASLRAEEAGLLACVHCGFCLNSCPTYRRLGHEGDSPRGRLDLMRAVMEGRLPADDPAFRLHLDQCLGCRACEPVCPSGVPYGFLLERGRHAIARASGVSLSSRLLIAAFTGSWRGVAGALSRLLRGTGLPGALVRLAPARFGMVRGGLAMLAASGPWRGLRSAGRRSAATGGAEEEARAAAPATAGTRAGAARPVPEVADGPGAAGDDVAAEPQRAFADPHALIGGFPAATGASQAAAPDVPERRRARVAMLTGCVQQALFGRVNDATRSVLEANGHDVVDAPGQRCCGALDAHAGRLERALELARQNIVAFEDAGADVVVVNAAGCGAMMKEYAEQLRHDPAWADRARAFTARVRDAAEFLVAEGCRSGAALPLTVTYDAPCHLHHAQRIREAPLRLLDGIPGLRRVPLRDADECCGGAGLYGIHHPELGGRITADKVAAVRDSGAQVVVTPNPGCIMQIGAGLRLQGDSTPVLHPIELIDESYRREREAE